MGYDLMVFAAEAAPHERQAFLAWYDQQTQWTEDHSYNDPSVTTPELAAWFADIIRQFPPMNGPLASDNPDDPHVTDYSVGRSVIYAAFAWSQAEAARAAVVAAAKRHHVGFFDVSSDNLAIAFPDDGTASNASGPPGPSPSKPWWRFW